MKNFWVLLLTNISPSTHIEKNCLENFRPAVEDSVGLGIVFQNRFIKISTMPYSKDTYHLAYLFRVELPTTNSSLY